MTEYRRLAAARVAPCSPRAGAPSRVRRPRPEIPADDAPDHAEYEITASPKPRMTRSDRWRKRPVVLRYRAYCDMLRALRVRIPHRYHAIFVLPMPASWSAARRAEMCGRPHQQVPDESNLRKALEDAVLPRGDQHLWDGRGTKIWGATGRLIVRRMTDDVELGTHPVSAPTAPS